MAKRGAAPLYYRVFSVLLQRIEDGDSPPGSRLPREDDLMIEFGVSRATIRQAVGELEDLNLVARRQGSGTFVLSTAGHISEQVFRGSLGELIGEIGRTKIRTVTIERGTALPARVAERLGIEDGTGAIIRRTRLMDGVPFAYNVNYVSSEIAELLSESELMVTGFMQLLESHGIHIGSATQTVRAKLADLTVAKALEIPVASPVLAVERLLLNVKREPIELVQSWYPGGSYAYTVTLDGSGMASRMA
jgi:GntR family transcriptional regulator